MHDVTGNVRAHEQACPVSKKEEKFVTKVNKGEEL